MQRLPDNERRLTNGVSMRPHAWDMAQGQASKRQISVSRLIEELVLGLVKKGRGDVRSKTTDVRGA